MLMVQSYSRKLITHQSEKTIVVQVIELRAKTRVEKTNEIRCTFFVVEKYTRPSRDDLVISLKNTQLPK